MDEGAEEEEKRRVPEVKLQPMKDLLPVGRKNVHENFLLTVSISVNLCGQRTIYKIKASDFSAPLWCHCSALAALKCNLFITLCSNKTL